MTAGRRLSRPGAGLLLGALAAAGVWAYGIAAAPLTVRANILYHTEPIGSIRGAATAGQSFVAPYPGLSGVDVSLADFGRANSGPVEFRLWTAPPGEPGAALAAAQAFQAEEINGDVMFPIRFGPQSDSAGRQYYFELFAPEATESNSITAYIQPSGPYPDGSAYWASAPTDGDLVFVLHFEAGGARRALHLLEQVTAGKPGPWGWGGFVLLLGAGYAALAAALIWQMRPR